MASWIGKPRLESCFFRTIRLTTLSSTMRMGKRLATEAGIGVLLMELEREEWGVWGAERAELAGEEELCS